MMQIHINYITTNCSCSQLPTVLVSDKTTFIMKIYVPGNMIFTLHIPQQFCSHFSKCLPLPSLWWRHNGHGSISNHQPHHCLLNHLFGCRSKKTSKLRVTGLCAGNSPGTGEFPAQMASNAETVSIWWRHHVLVRNNCHWVSTYCNLLSLDIWQEVTYT